ncbi:1-acylglycerol-3-phosphate O-acyltransferase ABHD5-like [Tubulanus polymorphus]|uniref:1-acylglycerol-3-phosphate O-acyltransferase ABHD5-like n=1 Tax=Tubulanus polymorphus TaxID=672921 RepID=UPI003DA631F8
MSEIESVEGREEILAYRRGWFQWVPTSKEFLAKVEESIFSYIKTVLQSRYVYISNNRQIWTVWANPKQSEKLPIVLIHGMGGGVGLWSLNIDSLVEKRPVYAFDLLGFGQSSRCSFSKDAMEAETTFVESIEEWRKTMGLEQFILLGHSLGGFLASSYTISYPQHVKHLILADPWGFPERPQIHEREYPIPIWARMIGALLSPFNPLSVLRAAGPWGAGLVQRFRPDLNRIFSSILPENVIFQYIYHCNAQNPSGETAFKHMSIPFGWAKNPMVHRITNIPARIPITMIYGSRSWLDTGIAYHVKYLRHESYVDVQVIRGAGHHVYADRSDMFNLLVKKICDTADHVTAAPTAKSSDNGELDDNKSDETVESFDDLKAGD